MSGGKSADVERDPASGALERADGDTLVPRAGDVAAHFPELQRQALYQRIANHVRDLISSEQLHPGERLPAERELARMLGVSRVPIREAMRTLAAQGLIEIRRGQGTYVASTSVDATVDRLTHALLEQRDLLSELFAVRRLLEPASAHWAAMRRDPAHVAALESLLDEMRQAAEADPLDYDAVGQIDTELHVRVAAGSANRVLLRIMEAVQDLHREQIETSVRYRGRLETTLRDHSRILSAIAAGDPVEARAAMVDHLTTSEAATMARIEHDGDSQPPGGLTPDVAELTQEAQPQGIARITTDIRAIPSGGEAKSPASFRRPWRATSLPLLRRRSPDTFPA
jgi:GntR family transcriptional repressor for pyruvate dehydrogenase complex